MADYLESVRRALAALEDQHRHVDADIADLRRILDRHGIGRPEGAVAVAPTPSRASGARAEILALLASEPMTALEIGKARGTSRNAAYAALQRMLDEELPPIEKVDDGTYRLASSLGEAQGSLPVEAGSEGEEQREGD